VIWRDALFGLIIAAAIGAFTADAQSDSTPLDLVGVTVTPHIKAKSLRYRNVLEPADGARVELFLRNNSYAGSPPLQFDGTTRTLFGGQPPSTLLRSGQWAWHDTPSATPGKSRSLPHGALTVWTFNGRKLPFGVGGAAQIDVGPEDSPWLDEEIGLKQPACWLSTVTFLGPEDAIHPDRVVVHIANESEEALIIQSCRLWLAEDSAAPRVLFPHEPLPSLEPFNGHATIPPNDRGGFVAKIGLLPRTYCAVEVTLAPESGDPVSIWGHLRIKPERFDISGGWVNSAQNNLLNEQFLKTLKRLHVNAAHVSNLPGYTNTDLYDRYPLKYIHPLKPFERFDTDSILPRIHGAEFLGEPQYGGGTPVPPQDVWDDLYPYTVTRLATLMTNSDESIWRDYAGLGDYPSYDAYRVSAPSADSWWKYDRWGDEPIGWGAPLETIGDLCRSLRELNRPKPCATWSQGPHHDWGVYGGRQRTSPTPDELRMQAYHAISTRITSFYWFNLSLSSLVKWPDTLDQLGRIGRELRMIDTFMLESDAYSHERITRRNGNLNWDIATVCGPRAALLFALDLDYEADHDEKIFQFAPPRRAKWVFPLPTYLGNITDVFRLDADGIHETNWKQTRHGIRIRERMNKVGMYVATSDSNLRIKIERERQHLIAQEEKLNFDPAHNEEDLAVLERMTKEK